MYMCICVYIYIYIYIYIFYFMLLFWSECSMLVPYFPFARHLLSKFARRLWVFWEDLKTPLISNLRSAFNKGELSNFQK